MLDNTTTSFVASRVLDLCSCAADPQDTEVSSINSYFAAIPNFLLLTGTGGIALVWCILVFTIKLEISTFGSSSSNVFSREQTRYRKYRQLETGQLAYFEPAFETLGASFLISMNLVFFHYDVVTHNIYWLRETAVQTICQPAYNWPWIHLC